MSCPQTDSEVWDRFLEGPMVGAAREEAEAHLEGCAECRAHLAALHGLREAAHALPREIAPARDLWPGIEARIAESRRALPRDLTIARPRRRPGGGWLAAAAAVLLIVLSSGVTALVLGGGDTRVAAVEARPIEARAPRAQTALAAFAPGEQTFERTVQSLTAELERRRSELSPETVRTIEENLRIIDQAIDESRRALEADPSNGELPLMLSDIYRRKVDLLSRAVRMQT